MEPNPNGMLIQTKVTDANQTQVPASLRTKYHVGPGDVVLWEERPGGDVRVRFRRRYTMDDLVGAAPGAGGGDAVAAKKAAQRRSP